MNAASTLVHSVGRDAEHDQHQHEQDEFE